MNRLLNAPNPQHMQQIFVNSPQFSWTRISSAQTVDVIHDVRMRFRVVEYMANLVANRSSITAETHQQPPSTFQPSNPHRQSQPQHPPNDKHPPTRCRSFCPLASRNHY